MPPGDPWHSDRPAGKREILRDECQHQNGCPARRLTVRALHHGQNIITEILLIRGKTDTWITEREARIQLPISFRQKICANQPTSFQP
jgi:hypothetical protein